MLLSLFLPVSCNLVPRLFHLPAPAGLHLLREGEVSEQRLSFSFCVTDEFLSLIFILQRARGTAPQNAPSVGPRGRGPVSVPRLWFPPARPALHRRVLPAEPQQSLRARPRPARRRPAGAGAREPVRHSGGLRPGDGHQRLQGAHHYNVCLLVWTCPSASSVRFIVRECCPSVSFYVCSSVCSFVRFIVCRLLVLSFSCDRLFFLCLFVRLFVCLLILLFLSVFCLFVIVCFFVSVCLSVCLLIFVCPSYCLFAVCLVILCL